MGQETRAAPTQAEQAQAEPATIPAVIARAHDLLPAADWDHLTGAAGTEVTLRRNRLAFDRIALRPRLLQEAEGRETGTSFMGERIELPVMLAPLGSVARYNRAGAVACARAAHAAGTVAFVSCLALPNLEEVRAATPGPLVSQIYLRGDRKTAVREIRRAEELGCVGVCMTADIAARASSDRGRGNARDAADAAQRSGWQQPALEHLFETEPFTWRDVEALRGVTSLPLILKGVTAPEDARIALECGVNVIYVSNHGGRLMDHLPSTMEMLPEVMAAVGGRAEVLVDGGFVRGTDVIKAIALGARAVLIGRLTGWALAAGGETVLLRVIELLRQEILEALAHLGAISPEVVDGEAVRPTFAAAESSWIGFAGAAGRIESIDGPGGAAL